MTTLTTCPVCGFPKVLQKFHGMDPYETCSEFCDGPTSEEDRKEWQERKPGTFLVFPCAECGCPTEGEWEPGSVCSDCSPGLKRVALERALRAVLDQKPVLPAGVLRLAEAAFGSQHTNIAAIGTEVFHIDRPDVHLHVKEIRWKEPRESSEVHLDGVTTTIGVLNRYYLPVSKAPEDEHG